MGIFGGSKGGSGFGKPATGKSHATRNARLSGGKVSGRQAAKDAKGRHASQEGARGKGGKK